MLYAFSENFVLPLSHDEVVHGKGSLLAKMPGDRWQKLANLRALYGYMWAHPGKKLLFMGGEFAQERRVEPRRERSTGTCSSAPAHAGIQALVRDLNRLYRDEPALWELDSDPAGFQWIEPNDADSERARVRARARPSPSGERESSCSPRTSRPCRARATGSACRARALARGAQHRLDASTAAATSATSAASSPSRSHGTASPSRPR